MLKIIISNKAYKDIKRAKKRHYDMELFKTVIFRLANNEILEPKYNDHPLSGKWSGCRECHLKPDWLLIYRIKNEILSIEVVRLGSHSDLFK